MATEREGRFCVECGQFSARLTFLLEEDGIPHGEPGHERRYLRLSLSHCANCGMGLLERDTHDCTNPAESWQRLERCVVWPADMPPLLQAVTDCPRAYDARCGCPLHQSLKGTLQPVWPVQPHDQAPRDSRCPRIKLLWREGTPAWKFGR